MSLKRKYLDDCDRDSFTFPLQSLPDELIQELFSHLPQSDKLSLCLLNKRCNKIATKLLYRRIYLNDSNVVKSDFMDLAINWSLLHIPSFLFEDESRAIANHKLSLLISTLLNKKLCVESVQWIRINWDLDSNLQRKILSILCNFGKSIQRLENITDPGCNDIISTGAISSEKVTSFDLAPPNSLPEMTVPNDYIPNSQMYLRQRISSRLSHMTLFIDPLKLFNYLYPLENKLQIVDLKLHWRSEFYESKYFLKRIRKNKFEKLSNIFDVRSLKVLTIISWNENLMEREIEMIKDFKEFTYIEDLSLISIKQDTSILVPLFSKLTKLKRLKMDFLDDYLPESTNPEIFLTMMLSCKNLQFIDMRFQGLDPSIISIAEVIDRDNSASQDNESNEASNKFILSQHCQCESCDHVFNEILKKKIFLFPEDYYFQDVNDIAAKDIFKMMRYLSLLPYSKACDYYPSVRTQPMNLKEFVKKMNENLLIYRQSRNQLIKEEIKSTDIDDILNDIQRATYSLPHPALTENDVICCYHALIHQFKTTYVAFLKRFPRLRFLMLNDIPTVVVEENNERVFEPIFYHRDYVTNLTGWSKFDSGEEENEHDGNGNDSLDTLTRKISAF
ncbi:hypothetical protein Kpol_2002p83 [Vanderwaltozyma polyspora DSM 70294]|uniref:F-box domain-containing protein n=1 Tax=Vanderwaltozyma polyspora (strain ATCC 22028 / DSM 70294 / BCRC 21397 / CBS 2163 / NBRC 10782 / NRRL Y-8283 / UCD 57-17) TaxID=436907 RepID=A7TFJ8_VANPO|nr:uncharacterized protein Kpol_2002p83 [Vanderwaltozyma polyspora DSM 70294]EDO19012.1 hypothetical protein Kpol_2002p83 [Vanderwaltozyma polyspora DSM 70294]